MRFRDRSSRHFNAFSDGATDVLRAEDQIQTDRRPDDVSAGFRSVITVIGANAYRPGDDTCTCGVRTHIRPFFVRKIETTAGSH